MDEQNLKHPTPPSIEQDAGTRCWHRLPLPDY
jgi:hypothetical protein